MSTMSHQHADAVLAAAYNSPATPYVWLHIGDPGEDGTDNVAQVTDGSPADIDRKAVAFGAPESHPENEERIVLSDGDVSWSGEEIDAAQEITHFSLWSAVSGGTLLDLGALTMPRTTGSDGAVIEDGELEVAIEVYVKPTPA